MASLDSLPPDQRAVLDLVLQRGRSYDDIARLLAIDRAAVRARALAAFDGIGPDTGLAPESRALIADYLLGQLPERVAEQTRHRLAELPYERAWARVLASELAPVAAKPLPEIPEGTARAKAPAPANAEAPAPAPDRPGTEPRPPKPERTRLPRPSDRPSSRLGGAIFLVVGAIVVVAIVVVLIALISGGKSSKHSSSASAAAAGTSTRSSTAPATTGTGTTATNAAKVVGQINLNPPSGTSAAKGIAVIVQTSNAFGVIIQASGLAPNSHNAYAVWLSNTPTDSTRVGFVNQAVGEDGKLQTGGPLPANAAHFKELLLTLETQNNPKAPGPTVLQGALKLPS
jgi:Sigma-70, region 4